MTKAEMQKRIDKLEEQLQDLGKLKELEARNKEMVTEIFGKKKEISKLKLNEENIQDRLNELSKKYNQLAKIFDDYIKGTDDIIQINKLFLRTALRTKELNDKKIKAFNGEGEE